MCHATFNTGQFAAVFQTHTPTCTPSRAHSPVSWDPPFNEPPACLRPPCPGTLCLCSCRLAAWKPGAPGHVIVAMPVEVPSSFLSVFTSSALMYLFFF